MSTIPIEPSLDATAIAAFHHHKAYGSTTFQLMETTHRINLVKIWDIAVGENIVEFGCGLGDTTTVLATAAGPEGHVVGVDPGPPDYGRPLTLGQAQSHINETTIGSRIEWVQEEPVAYLSSLPSGDKPTFTSAVLSHMMWYIPRRDILLSIFKTLRPHASRLCLAEYSLSAPPTRPSAYPMVLAALFQAAFAAHVPEEDLKGNIRCVLSPAAVTEVAKEAGWKLEKEAVIAPQKGSPFGKFEVQMALNGVYPFTKDIGGYLKNNRHANALLAIKDALAMSTESVGGAENVSPMDVWVAVFT